MGSFLVADSITKGFGFNRVLTDIAITCKTGEITGLLGRNGTGKSTLLKILFGTAKADSKFIRIDGKVYDKPYQTSGLIAYLPQDSFVPAQLTVAKAIQLYLGKNQIPSFEKDTILNRVLLNQISQLSGGELRYLEINLLLRLPSKFLLLDEPFNGLSPVLIDAVKVRISEFCPHKGMIISDHDYNNVLEIATRCCLLYDGSLKDIRGRNDLIRWGYLSESSI